MTVSMFTTRLSWVITGWGGNGTTCSRRSMRLRMVSMNGTTMLRPALSVRVYRPKRSTMAALACGMTWIVLIRAMKTNTTRMIKTMMTGSIVFPRTPSPPRRFPQILWLLKILLVECDRPSPNSRRVRASYVVRGHMTIAVAPSMSTTSTSWPAS